jgi:hypothetical protein
MTCWRCGGWRRRHRLQLAGLAEAAVADLVAELAAAG